jgi:hypothetical protein
MFEDSSWIDASYSCSDAGRRLPAVLSGLSSTKMVREFDMIENYDLGPVLSVYDNPLEALLHVPKMSTMWWSRN